MLSPLSSEKKTSLTFTVLPAWFIFCSHWKIPANNNPFKRHMEGKGRKGIRKIHVPGKRKKHLGTVAQRSSKYRLENKRSTYVHIFDTGSYQKGRTGYAAAPSLQWPRGHYLSRSAQRLSRKRVPHKHFWKYPSHCIISKSAGTEYTIFTNIKCWLWNSYPDGFEFFKCSEAVGC